MKFKSMLVAALLGLSSIAQSAIIYTPDQTVAFGDVTNQFDLGNDITRTIQKFDTQSGMFLLREVFIQLEGFVTSTIRIQNTSDIDGVNVEGVVDATLQLGTTGVSSPLVITLPSILKTATLGAFQVGDNFNGTSGVTFENESGTDIEAATYTQNAILALFSGLGTINIDFTSSARTGAFSNNGSITSDITSGVYGTALVRYGYETAEIPEPQTIAMIGLALMLIALRRRTQR